MQIIDSEKLNTNYELCALCGGHCCQRNACDCSPKDFQNDLEEMRKALEGGKYSIDYSRNGADEFICTQKEIILFKERVLHSKDGFFYIRPKNIGRPTVDIIHKEKSEGPCIFWSIEKGCELSYKERPVGGRTLIPFPELECLGQYTRDIMWIEWRPFTEALIEIAKELWDYNWYLYKELKLKIE